MDLAAILILVTRAVDLAQKLVAENRAKTTAEETASLLQSQSELEVAYKQLFPDSPLPGPSDVQAPPQAIEG